MPEYNLTATEAQSEKSYLDLYLHNINNLTPTGFAFIQWAFQLGIITVQDITNSDLFMRIFNDTELQKALSQGSVQALENTAAA